MLIKLTKITDGSTLILNPDHIASIELIRARSRYSMIIMATKNDDENDYYEVKELPEEIYQQIEESKQS